MTCQSSAVTEGLFSVNLENDPLKKKFIWGKYRGISYRCFSPCFFSHRQALAIVVAGRILLGKHSRRFWKGCCRYGGEEQLISMSSEQAVVYCEDRTPLLALINLICGGLY